MSPCVTLQAGDIQVPEQIDEHHTTQHHQSHFYIGLDVEFTKGVSAEEGDSD